MSETCSTHSGDEKYCKNFSRQTRREVCTGLDVKEEDFEEVD